MVRIVLVLFSLFFSFPLTGCYSQSQQLIQEGKENTDPYLWDFGQVKAGEVLKHGFILKNDTDKTFKINNITTSCGCTGSEAKKKVIAPGDYTIIEVKFNTKGYSGSTQQFVYVNTDNLDNLLYKFTVKAEVIKQVGN